MEFNELIAECHMWLDTFGFPKKEDLLQNGEVVGEREMDLDDRVYNCAQEWKMLKAELAEWKDYFEKTQEGSDIIFISPKAMWDWIQWTKEAGPNGI